MIALLMIAVLAFGADSATSERKIIAKGRCYSKYEGNTYHTIGCRIPGAPTNQTLYLKVSSVRYPYTCNEGNYGVYNIKGQLYIEVKNGCNAYFEVSIDEKKVVSKQDGCGVANDAAGFRIVGGKTAGECQYPWMVVVYNEVKKTLCGGSILDNRHILTAAHCVTVNHTTTVHPASYFAIFSGSSKISTASRTFRKHKASKIIVHKNYFIDSLLIRNDIAVIKLSANLKFDKCRRPICLSDGSKDVQNLEDCRVMGWGRVSNTEKWTPRNLQWTSNKAVSKTKCYREYGHLSTDKNFCAVGVKSGACNGDSGGPFTCKHKDGKFYQYGIVSSGRAKKCGTKYTVYTYINAYGEWIKDAIN